MDFEAFLVKKKIDSAAFKANERARWEEFSLLFAQMHPESFTNQKLFLINQVRRRYPLAMDHK